MNPPAAPDHPGRPAGTTEHGWCRAVPGGTGITVLAVHLSRPIPTAIVEEAIHNVQLRHPLLRARIANASTKKNHFSISPSPTVRVRSFDSSATDAAVAGLPDRSSSSVLRSLVEHELNLNPWKASACDTSADDVFFASVYALQSGSEVLVLRIHTAVADRTSGWVIVEEMLGLIGGRGGSTSDYEVVHALEDLVPAQFAKKALWSRGIGMVGYSMNFLRSSTLPFADANSPRASRMVTLELGVDETQKLLSCCKERGIKLCGVLTAAGLIGAVRTRNLPNKKHETHTIITLIDCRKRLTKALSKHDVGFYHSGIQNAYTVNGEEEMWELSAKCFSIFSNARDRNKDLTDMADLNILMMKAIDNPGMTPSSSLRTALISVFEEPEVYDTTEFYQGVDVEDYVGCSSTHGVGTSIAIFDAISDGRLVCTCLYPSPLHSRELIQGIVDEMKKIVVAGLA